MPDRISVEAMLSEPRGEHFPVEIVVTVEHPDGTPTGVEKIVVVCGCDPRYSYDIGHEEFEEDTGFLDLLLNYDQGDLPNFGNSMTERDE